MTVPHTKLEAVLAIVDWEHRYKFRHLESGGWCIQRIRELMQLSRPVVAGRFEQTFGVPLAGKKRVGE